jgi:hypothetical protein
MMRRLAACSAVCASALIAATGCGSRTDRAADSLIPTSARWLEATVTQRSSPLQPRSKERTLRTVVATNPSVVQAVAQSVNALPLANPEGPAPSCPVYSPPFVHLTFRKTAASSATLAEVVAADEACVRRGGATVLITTARVNRLDLTDTLAPRRKSLIDLIEAALGRRLGLG